ncbi:NUDIX hydrolase [Bacillus taeanensis]|uniref:ADP-ribose pyrophosphatase n=1 Tax=Bacillus taeanensis TaxID=273032 RepID=A0A366XR04_9BACI|nr:NUDIX hydrolase [Bacillus taeanensis]RBW67555.1 ADP-ribose pyrophosphatase [Bacillus taeanensis]
MANYVKELRSFVGSRPIILVGSTIAVFNDHKEILLQYRSDTRDWGLPGGAMELGESLEETAKRELFEETGLTATSIELIDVLSGEELYFKYPHGDEVYNVIALYIANEVSGKLVMNDGESLDLKYFSLEDLPSQLEGRAKIIIDKHFI